MTVRERLVQIFGEQLGRPAEEFVAEARLVHDLCIDSLDMVELVMEVEDEFEISLPDERVERCEVFLDVVELVCELRRAQAERGLGEV